MRGALDPRLVARMTGFVQSLEHRRPKDRLHRWLRHGDLSISEADISAWSRVRNAIAHGRLPQRPELQDWLDDFYRIANIINHLALRMMGYKGLFRNYSSEGWPDEEFPHAG
jgi:hypothetical protein